MIRRPPRSTLSLHDALPILVVVEHDEDTIRRADHIIDIGPSAGIRGGRLVAQGTAADIMAAEDSITGRYLLRSEEHTSELQSQSNLVCRLLLEKKKTTLLTS